MTTNNHPITPPPELVTDWCGQLARENDYGPTCVYDIAIQAARWGADQELEACCEWLRRQNLVTHCALIPSLRAARRPKPLSLKEQALEVVTGLEKRWDLQCDLTLLRRALEQLDD